MGRRIAILLLLAPEVALGQGAVTALVSTQTTAGIANRTDCASTTTSVTWNWTASGITTINSGDLYRLAAYNSACSTTTVPTAGSSNTVAPDLAATGLSQSTNSVFVSSMASAGGVTNCSGPNDMSIYLCVYYVPASGTPSLVSTGNFNFQLAIPPEPTINSVSPNDSSLTVNISPGTTDANHTATASISYTVTCAPESGSGGTSTGSGAAGNITCGGLTNFVVYNVTAYATSQAGNQGPTSATYPPGQATTPLPFEDFWQVYKGAGGVEQGGCGTGGSGALLPAGALATLWALRRRRR